MDFYPIRTPAAKVRNGTAPICPAFGARWPRRVISWRCIAASSKTKKPAATYNAWISAFPQSSLNSIDSPQTKNEERLAGQPGRILISPR
jgi:hypothetical protein